MIPVIGIILLFVLLLLGIAFYVTQISIKSKSAHLISVVILMLMGFACTIVAYISANQAIEPIREYNIGTGTYQLGDKVYDAPWMDETGRYYIETKPDVNQERAKLIVVFGGLLHIITFVSYISRKSWSLLMSIITLVFLNVSLLYQMFVFSNDSSIRVGMAFSYLLWLLISLIASIANAKHLSLMQDDKNKALWMKINVNPTGRDNTLFKAGCAIASVVMGLSLTLPFFSINIQQAQFSESFSFIDIFDVLNEYFGYRDNPFVDIVMAAVFLLVFYIVILFFASFSKSKANKTTLGITLGLSIYAIVFGTQTIIRSAIEDFFTLGQPQIDNLGLAEYISSSIFGVFGSVFRFEIGAIVLISSIVAYILFASCQFSRIRKPNFALSSGMVMQTAPVIKLRCGECNGLNDDTATFCSGCGKPLVKAQEPKPLPAIITCNKCGAKLEETIKFCTACGTPKSQDTDSEKIETKNCTSCNAELSITMKFCDKCGANIQDN